jgi:dsRNA-specific ribonuclease
MFRIYELEREGDEDFRKLLRKWKEKAAAEGMFVEMKINRGIQYWYTNISKEQEYIKEATRLKEEKLKQDIEKKEEEVFILDSDSEVENLLQCDSIDLGFEEPLFDFDCEFLDLEHVELFSQENIRPFVVDDSYNAFEGSSTDSAEFESEDILIDTTDPSPYVAFNIQEKFDPKIFKSELQLNVPFFPLSGGMLDEEAINEEEEEDEIHAKQNLHNFLIKNNEEIPVYTTYSTLIDGILKYGCIITAFFMSKEYAEKVKAFYNTKKEAERKAAVLMYKILREKDTFVVNEIDYKAILHEFCTKTYHTPPRYFVSDIISSFKIVDLVVEGQVFSAKGLTRREAENLAAKDYIIHYNINIDTDCNPKGHLQTVFLKRFGVAPQYLRFESGPEHSKFYCSQIRIPGLLSDFITSDRFHRYKEAQNDVAKKTLLFLKSYDPNTYSNDLDSSGDEKVPELIIYEAPISIIDNSLEDEEYKDDLKCVICLDNDRQVTLIHEKDVGHFVVCHECSIVLKKTNALCPVCREGILFFIRTYA